MKRLNIKLVVTLVVVAVTAVVGVYFAHAFQYGAAADSSRQDADALLKDGKRSEALRQYVNYLTQKDTAADPQVLLDTARLADSIAHEQPSRDTVTQAIDLLRQAMRQLPDNAELRAKYAELMMSIPRYQEAVESLLWLTAPERGKHEPKYDIMLAECYIHRSFYDKAVEVCSPLIGFDPKTLTFDATKARAPDQLDAYELIARLLREQVDPRQPKTADLVMDQLVAANQNSYQAHLRRARYLQQYKRGEGSKDDLAIALKLAPDDPDVIIVAAQAAMLTDKLDESQSLLARGLKLYPKNVSMYRQWAVLKSNQNKLGEAEADVQKGLKLLPGNPDMLWILCEIQLQKRDLPAARETLTALSKTNFRKVLIDLMDARILFFDGKWREAVQHFEKLRPQMALMPEHTKEIDLDSATCYGQLGEYDKQLDACRRVLQSDPASYQARVGIAAALMATGKTEEAKRAYETLAQAVGKDKAISIPQIWRPIVQLRMDEQMRLPKDKRNWSGVDAIIKLLDKVVAPGEKEPDAAAQSAVVLMKAEVELRKGNLAQAQQLLLDAKKAFPTQPPIWSALATVTFRIDGSAAALKVLDEAPAEIRDTVALRLNHAGILLRQGGEKVKASILALDANSDKLSVADRARLWSGLGAALLSIGDQEGAERFWMKVTEISPDDLKIRFSLFDLARDTGDDSVMAKMVEQFRTMMGVTSAEARYADAARSVALVKKQVRERTPTGRQAVPLNDDEKQSLSSARKLLEEVGQARANWFEVARTLGDIDVLENNVDAAISDYQLALKLGPPDPLTIRPLVLLLSRQNRPADVKAALDLIGTANADELGIGRISIENELKNLKSDDVPAALARAKLEVPDDSRDPSAHLWLAELYDRAGHPVEAEASFRRAVATGPEQPETWLRLLEHLAEHHDDAKIGEVLSEAHKQLPEDRVNQVLGPGYELIGQYPQAEQYYLAALEAAPDDPSTHRIVANFYMRIGRADQARKQALTVLRLAGDDPKNVSQVIWARRTLAKLLASTGNYQDFLKAKALLAENVQTSGGDFQDKLQLADLLGSRISEPSSWEEATKLLESVKTLPPAVQVQLAHFHEVLGNWTDARDEMVKFLTEQKAAPAAYVVFIDMCLRHDDTARASSWLDRLDAVEPTKPSDGLTPPLVLRSRVLAKQGQTEDAVALLKSVLPSRPLPPDKIPLLRSVAMQLAQLGLNPAAEDLLREYVGYEPSAKLQLASFLGRTGRLDESLDLCEQSLKTYPMALIMEVAGEVFEAQPSRIEPKHIQRVEKWYQTALRDDPESARLLLQLARFREISGRLDEAEHLYRDLLHRNDLDSIQRATALNNLAFSLAGRKKDLADALAFINEAARLFGENSDVLDTRGMVYVAMANYPAALADLTEAVRIPEPSPVKFLHLALAQGLSGDRTAALLSFERAKELKLDPTSLRKVERDSYDRLSKDLNP